MSNIVLQGSEGPITQLSDQAVVAGPGVTSAVQLTATKAACTLVEIQALEINTAPIAVGGSGTKLGTAASSYSDRVGVVIAPGASKVLAVPDPSMIYISGKTTDSVTWTIYK